MNKKDNDNDLTLQAYQEKTQEYVDGTPPIDDVIREWIDSSLALMPSNSTVLEVGSGFGRDAEYIRQKGFTIECSDAVPNFVKLLADKGFNARRINLLTDELGSGYGMVIADAVLLHFTPEESRKVAMKIYTALEPEGIFALRMKQGDGPVWSEEKLGEPRYFHYWKPEDLEKLLTDCGFEWVSMAESYTSHNNASWMHIIVRKASTVR